ncbi:TylF/MycF/NovP-related O-methyltransferase [Segetibacter sp.]|jgi:O-methyltransferase|uniref:TylF/MycF/NovP-related O-methyltransferase n=1 Tax=Segetibacter sp. TaxID=2231182 RepID=UPI00263044D9|nr:TylF/MycF/NovP-related O-methyltransferase [Segetibacter sp.]MCW3081252.1 hypothetical protein [Segetibacter sp.]
MNNFFINQKPFNVKEPAPIVQNINRVLKRLKFNYVLQPIPNPIKDMTTIEQRINFFHLLENVIVSDIKGDVVELGCFTGQCAMLFQKTIEIMQANKKLHLYDSFSSKFTIEGSVVEALQDNFRKADLRLPEIYPGYFNSTLPKELPESIAFAHIDCGFGGDPLQHKEIVTHCLSSIYPRMSKGSVCVLMDYHDSSLTDKGFDANPGVKLACDEFLAGKEEKVTSLFGNQYSHGFFRRH